jgi:hypothetical protein
MLSTDLKAKFFSYWGKKYPQMTEADKAEVTENILAVFKLLHKLKKAEAGEYAGSK